MIKNAGLIHHLKFPVRCCKGLPRPRTCLLAAKAPPENKLSISRADRDSDTLKKVVLSPYLTSPASRHHHYH
jgi:hypothetical protein